MLTEYEYNLQFRPSSMRRTFYLAQSAVIFLIFTLHSFSVALWLLLWPWLAFCFYRLLQQWRQPLPAQLLFLSAQGQLKWWQDALPQGQLSADSLVSGFGIWLCWQDQQQQRQQLWVYRDNLSEADFRSLSRVCQTVRWQQCP